LAGALYLETNDPTFYNEASILGGFGDFRSYESAIMASGPINDEWALRLTAEVEQRRGEFAYPLYEGLPRRNERAWDSFHQVRGKILYQPGEEEDGRVLFTVSHSYDSPLYQDVDGGPTVGFPFSDRKWGFQTDGVFVEARSTEVTQGSADVTFPINDSWSL
ncbi:MAG: hypothetical protein AAGC68_11795, partial [Verrucomicrobiota bacterium]